MSLRSECNPRIVELLELLSAAIVHIGDDPKDPYLKIILERLFLLGQGDDVDQVFIRLRAIQHKADIMRDLHRFNEALELYGQARSLLSPNEAEYHIETAGMIRTLFDKGEVRQGFELLGQSVLDGIDQSLNRKIVHDYFKLACYANLSAGLKEETFKRAIIDYAVCFLNLQKETLIKLYDQDPSKVFGLVYEDARQTD